MGNIPDPVEAKKYLSRKSIMETEKWDDLKYGEQLLFESLTVTTSNMAPFGQNQGRFQ
jgi:hypothetical protein